MSQVPARCGMSPDGWPARHWHHVCWFCGREQCTARAGNGDWYRCPQDQCGETRHKDVIRTEPGYDKEFAARASSPA